MWLRSAKPLHSLDTLRKCSKSPWLLPSCSFSDSPHNKSKLAPLQVLSLSLSHGTHTQMTFLREYCFNSILLLVGRSEE